MPTAITDFRLRSIRIEGFRALREPLELDFSGSDGEPLDTVVLVGPNGSGKTSILEGILFAFGLGSLIEPAGLTAPRYPRSHAHHEALLHVTWTAGEFSAGFSRNGE